MKILITGGKGFIAKNLQNHLKDHDIDAPGSSELNLLDYEEVSDYLQRGFDIVIHAATYDAAPKYSTKDPAKVLENNLKMFFNLARCEKDFRKMIYFGSGAEFSRQHWKPRMDEDFFGCHIPEDQYGFSKYIMARYAEKSEKIYNLRLFAVFGPHEDWKVRLISNICHQVMSSDRIVINENKQYDFLYMEDLAKIVEWFIMNAPKHHAYNVCSGRTEEFRQIAEKISRLAGKSPKIEILRQGKEYSGDNSRLMQETGFELTPFDNALEKTCRWFADNGFR